MSEVKNYTTKEVAEILSISVFTVNGLLRKGKLEGFKITSRWRVSQDSLDKFMETCKQEE